MPLEDDEELDDDPPAPLPPDPDPPTPPDPPTRVDPPVPPAPVPVVVPVDGTHWELTLQTIPCGQSRSVVTQSCWQAPPEQYPTGQSLL